MQSKDGSLIVEITLSTGTVVRCQPCPPYALGDVLDSLEEPPYPFVDVPSIAGGSQSHPALRETPEFQQYVRDMAKHNKQVKIELESFALQHGVVSWKFPGSDEFSSEPPDGWQMPPYMVQRHGLETSSDPYEYRMQFIKHGLILYSEDSIAIEEATSKPFKPLSNEEVTSAMSPFDSGDPKVQL